MSSFGSFFGNFVRSFRETRTGYAVIHRPVGGLLLLLLLWLASNMIRPLCLACRFHQAKNNASQRTQFRVSVHYNINFPCIPCTAQIGFHILYTIIQSSCELSAQLTVDHFCVAQLNIALARGNTSNKYQHMRACAQCREHTSTQAQFQLTRH